MYTMPETQLDKANIRSKAKINSNTIIAIDTSTTYFHQDKSGRQKTQQGNIRVKLLWTGRT
jgi:hypothetical protein